MELVDLIDKNGNLTGKCKERKEVHKLGLKHHASGVIICWGDPFATKVFMKDKNAGLWDLSASGHISSGETPIKSLIREIKEELGLEVEEQELKLLGKFWRNEIYKENYIENELDYIYILKKYIDLKDISVQKEEVEQVAWISIDEFKNLLKNKQAVNRVGVWDELFNYIDK